MKIMYMFLFMGMSSSGFSNGVNLGGGAPPVGIPGVGQNLEVVDRGDHVPESGDEDVTIVVPGDGGRPQFLRSKSGSVSDHRCAGDSLTPAQSRRRLMWAGDNNIIPRELVIRWLYRVVDNKVVQNARPYYPMFGTWNGKPNQTRIWKPEKNGMPSQVPHPNRWVTVCRSSCYTPDQLLSTPEGLIEAQEAQLTAHPSISTLGEKASFDDIYFQDGLVDKYTVSFQDTWHDIVEFQTETGKSLKVTTNHPLVTTEGTIAEAASFKVGDFLVNEEGEKELITSLTPSKYWGKVYNLRPVAEEPIKNILSVQGILNGSDRFQNEYFDLIKENK